jgi:hypothetical protein
MLELIKRLTLIVKLQVLLLGSWKFVVFHCICMVPEVQLSCCCPSIICGFFFFFMRCTLLMDEDFSQHEQTVVKQFT